MENQNSELRAAGKAKDDKVMRQQPLDGPIAFTLTPEMLNKSVFFDADRFEVYDHHQIDPMEMCLTSYITAENGDNYIRLASVDSSEDLRPGASLQEIEAANHFCILLELKIGNRFINAEFGPYPCRYNRMIAEDFTLRANNAFVRAAVLIGIPASIGIVIDEDAAFRFY